MYTYRFTWQNDEKIIVYVEELNIQAAIENFFDNCELWDANEDLDNLVVLKMGYNYKHDFP